MTCAVEMRETGEEPLDDAHSAHVEGGAIKAAAGYKRGLCEGEVGAKRARCRGRQRLCTPTVTALYGLRSTGGETGRKWASEERITERTSNEGVPT
jgi:hypothetical protein